MVTTTMGGRLERMRRRQAAAGPVAVRPMYQPRPVPAGPVEKLAAVLAAVGVSDRDRHVLGQRLRGRSCEEVAWDRESRAYDDGGALSRQRIHQIERNALAAVGLAGTVERFVHADTRAGGADLARGRGAGVRAADLTDTETAPRYQSRSSRADREHERAVRAFLRSKGVRS